MATTAEVDEELGFANGSGSGITITNYEGNDILLWRTGEGERDMGYGVKPYVTAILVTVELDPKAKGDPFIVIGRTTIPQTVLVEALKASPVVVGRLEKPAKAYRIASFDEPSLERLRGLWPDIVAAVSEWIAEHPEEETEPPN